MTSTNQKLNFKLKILMIIFSTIIYSLSSFAIDKNFLNGQMGYYKTLKPGVYLLVLNPPSKLIESLSLFQKTLQIKSASITGVGVTRNTTLGFYKFNEDGTPGGGAHTDDVVKDPREIVSLNCNLTTQYIEKDKSPITPPPHCHIALAGVAEPAIPNGNGWSVVGGHLIEAEVAVTAELIITTYQVEVTKVPSLKFGGKVIDLQNDGIPLIRGY